MKLGLGTAQFGLDYGISNVTGKIQPEEGKKILAMAQSSGISLIDTAPSYGDSESALGNLLPKDSSFRLVTKTIPTAGKAWTKQSANGIAAVFKTSLTKLRCDSVYGLLVHHAEDLLAPESQWLLDVMQELVRRGFVKKLGVSIYTAKHIDQALRLFTPDLIQIPINIFDQRLIRSGHLQLLHEKGIEIHARSIFLQGLLLMDPAELHPFFGGVKEQFERYHRLLDQEKQTPLQMALQFIAQHHEIDTALVGVSCASELRQIIDASSATSTFQDWESLAIQDEQVLNPSLWKMEDKTRV